MEITSQIAIDKLQEMVTDLTCKLNNTPAFLEEERQNLEMEINTYKRDLERIRGGDMND